MEHIRNAKEKAANQIKHLTNKQYATNLLGESLEDLARKCTDKTLPAPSRQANNTFLEAVRSSSATDDHNAAKEIVSVLKRRLAMDNAHKQWLAIHLVSDILRETPESLTSTGREEILSQVAELTRRPANKTNNPNGEAVSESMHKTKLAALDLLRTSGGVGQQALRQAAGIGGAANMQRALQQAQYQHQGGGGGASSWEALASETNSCIDTVQGHVELVQQLLFGDETGEFEQELINDLMNEMVTYSQTFEPLLGQLAAIETREAEALLAKALETFDMIGQCQQLQSDVVEARLTGQAPPVAPGAASTAGTSAAPAPALENRNSFDALGLGELQSALEATQAQPVDPFSQMGGADPFAAAASTSAAADPFAAASPPPATSTNPFGQPEPLKSTPPQAVSDDPFAALATGGDPFSSPPVQQSPPPAQVPPSAGAVVDPFAALTAPATSSPPAQHSTPPPAGAAADPFAALTAPAGSSPSPNSHLSPEALLQDLTKAPKPAGQVPAKGVPMRAGGAPAGQFSANNPFAAAAAVPAAAAPPTAAAIDDEWDKFFNDRMS